MTTMRSHEEMAPQGTRQVVQKRRVALIFGSFRTGGVARVMLTTAAGLLERGIAVDLVVGRSHGDMKADVPKGAKIVELRRSNRLLAKGQAIAANIYKSGELLAWRAPGKIRYLPSLVSYFREAQPDAVLAATSPFNLMAVWARRLAQVRCRVVVSEHNQLSHGNQGIVWKYDSPPRILGLSYEEADAVVAVSNGVADEMSEHTGFPRGEIATVYNPIALDKTAALAQQPLDHPWFAAGEPPVVIGAGKLTPRKDFATLIRAFARVRGQRRARLIVLGGPRDAAKDGDYVQNLKVLARELDVERDVDFVGFVANPLAYMSRADVFVLSSAVEPFGMVLIEALACGCPVVSTDCPSGPAEILQGGRYGPLVPVGDDGAMADAILSVLDKPLPKSKLQARASMFGVQRAVDQYVGLMFGP